MKRPTFFISSTIFDFQDLRSALKFYLERQGCKVLASEFNDFTKPLDEHSYDACLKSISTADYFILLIGSRVGGWYDETQHISITRAEYREAYRLHKAGQLQLLNFVRRDVWQARENRKELSKHLELLSIRGKDAQEILKYPSKFANDAQSISGFLEEVGRNGETLAATRGAGVKPTGNWVHVFTHFSEVIDVIDGYLLTSTPIEDLTMHRLLRRELREFVRMLLIKTSNGATESPRFMIERFHKRHPIDIGTRQNSHTTIFAQSWDNLKYLGAQLLRTELHPIVLPQVISMPTFLEFDTASGTYHETAVYDAALTLVREIRKLKQDLERSTLAIIFDDTTPDGTNEVDIQTYPLVRLLRTFDLWINVLELSTRLLEFLDGGDFVPPDLRPDSPISGMQERIDAETPTDSDLDAFLERNRSRT